MRKFTFTAIVVATAIAGTVEASTLNFSALSASDLSALTPQANPNATSSTGTYFSNVVGNQYNGGGGLIARSPWEQSIHANSGMFSSVQGNSSATFQFSKVQTSLSLIWGSPDSYNDLIIELSGVGGSETFNGSDVFGSPGILASFVEITDVQFDTLTLTSGSNAFEFANLDTTPVPLPAAGFLLLGALGGLGLARRKRKAA